MNPCIPALNTLLPFHRPAGRDSPSPGAGCGFSQQNSFRGWRVSLEHIGRTYLLQIMDSSVALWNTAGVRLSQLQVSAKSNIQQNAFLRTQAEQARLIKPSQYFSIDNNKLDASDLTLLRNEVFSVVQENSLENKSVEDNIETIFKKLTTKSADINPAFVKLIEAVIESPEKFDINNDDIVNAAKHCRGNMSHSDIPEPPDCKISCEVIIKYIISQLEALLKTAPITIDLNNVDLKKKGYDTKINKEIMSFIPDFMASELQYIMTESDLEDCEFLFNKIFGQNTGWPVNQNVRLARGTIWFGHPGESFIKLKDSIKNLAIYRLSGSSEQHPCVTDFNTLILQLIQCGSPEMNQLLESMISVSFYKPLTQKPRKCQGRVECMFFNNIDFKRDIEALHLSISSVKFFSHLPFLFLPLEYYQTHSLHKLYVSVKHRLQRPLINDIIRLNKQGELPFDLYVNSQKIDTESLTDYRYEHIAIQRLIKSGRFKKLLPASLERHNTMKDTVCPITFEQLDECESLIAYSSMGRDCLVSENAILWSLCHTGNFKCPYTQERILTSGSCPAGVMKVIDFEHCDKSYYLIRYKIFNGVQNAKHDNPGSWFTGTQLEAFLPKNDEGARVCMMLKEAFAQKLTFSVGFPEIRDVNFVTLNKIDHKPCISSLDNDPEYLSKVRNDLEARGIPYPDSVPTDEALFQTLDNQCMERQAIVRGEHLLRSNTATEQ